MTEQLGKIDKPETKQFKGKRRLYVVPLLYSWHESPPDYLDKLEIYWQQVREQIANLESRIGAVSIVYHETVTDPGEEGLSVLEKLNRFSHQLVREKCLMGAELAAAEDRELVEEAMDWERHLILGFASDKVARIAYQSFAEASKKRNEHMANRIRETLREDGAGMLFIREGHQVQFPSDIDVFLVAPPALDEIHRWLRERQEKQDAQDDASTSAEGTGPASDAP
jgi:hypothetical protein